MCFASESRALSASSSLKGLSKTSPTVYLQFRYCFNTYQLIHLTWRSGTKFGTLIDHIDRFLDQDTFFCQQKLIVFGFNRKWEEKNLFLSKIQTLNVQICSTGR